MGSASPPTRVTPPPDEGFGTILLALLANLGVGVLKLAAGLISGSAVLLSEAAHSAGDSLTELFLFVAVRRSDHPADREHPFGYGKERYFWSLLAAMAIFVSGAGFSMYEGVRTITGGEPAAHWLWLNYPVLVLAAVLEGLSLRNAARRVRGAAARRRRSIGDYVRRPDDPTVNSVALEDTAALIGIAIAALGVALHQLTGDPLWDGIASLLIGVLLLTVVVVLARACEGLLIGRQADLGTVRAIEAHLEGQPEIDDVVDLLTMQTGVGRVLVGVRADFVDTLSAADLEAACVRIDGQLRAELPELDEVFIQPASRADRGLRRRVVQRYGAPMADS
jgi:cation diffusion facilitator family transporter